MPTWPSSSSPPGATRCETAVGKRLLETLDNQFTLLRGRVNPLQNGPPVAYPVQFRVSGPDYAKIREIAGTWPKSSGQQEHDARAPGLERAE